MNIFIAKTLTDIISKVLGRKSKSFKSVKYGYLDGSSRQQHDLPPQGLWTTDVMTQFVLTAFSICANVMVAPEMQINESFMEI